MRIFIVFLSVVDSFKSTKYQLQINMKWLINDQQFRLNTQLLRMSYFNISELLYFVYTCT